MIVLLLIGLVIFVMLTTWKRGRGLLARRLAADAIPVDAFIMGCGEVTRVPGTAVFLTTAADAVPHALLHSMKHYKAIHDRVVLATAKVLDVPYVPEAQRVTVEKLPNAFWRVGVHYGFMDQPNLPAALEWCAEQGLELEPMDTTYFGTGRLARDSLRHHVPQCRQRGQLLPVAAGTGGRTGRASGALGEGRFAHGHCVAAGFHQCPCQ